MENLGSDWDSVLEIMEDVGYFKIKDLGVLRVFRVVFELSIEF